MQPNKDIFCNSPWFELQIYWDGSYGFCCAEDHKIYDSTDAAKYNVKNMSIQEWMNSKPMKDVRKSMLGDSELSICARCQITQEKSGTSRRHQCNQKSAIFTKNHFLESFNQSPHKNIFLDSIFDDKLHLQPLDLHIDLGNYCNLACKMCGPLASSRIATHYNNWGIKKSPKEDNFDGASTNDWTRDQSTFNRIVREIASFKNLQNIHFMGGETIIQKGFVRFLDRLIEAGRHDVGISFVTNGTVYNKEAIEKLQKFSGRVNIEISIETTTQHNSYIRQGTDTGQVLTHIKKYQEICDSNNWDITIRPALSSLSVGYYNTLLKYCLDQKLLIKSMIVEYPNYLKVCHLPDNVKQKYIKKYQEFAVTNNLQVEQVSKIMDFNESDKHNFKKLIALEVDKVLNMLKENQTSESEFMLEQMSVWCKKWDKVFQYDPKKLYPEFHWLYG